MHESVNRKVEALHSKMMKEVDKIEQCHLSLQGKIDVVDEAIKKLVQYYTSFTTKFDVKVD